MTLTLITRKISNNNVLKLLDLGTDSTYTELLNHPSSAYYNECAKLLEELQYDGPINYRSISKFLLDNVWNKRPEHFRIVAGKFYYDGPSFIDDVNVEKLAFDN
jgi:menaquinone-dependent protoporphyrinogen IX oxidase